MWRLTLRGVAFGSPAYDSRCSVLLGGAELRPGDADLLRWGKSTIRLRVPPGAGAVDVRVRTAAGDSNAVSYTYP